MNRKKERNLAGYDEAHVHCMALRGEDVAGCCQCVSWENRLFRNPLQSG